MRLASLLAGALFLATACGGGSGPSPAAGAMGGQLTATLTDNAIQLSQSSIPNGPVTITVKNAGTVVHTLVVLKTNLGHDKIPRTRRRPTSGARSVGRRRSSRRASPST